MLILLVITPFLTFLFNLIDFLVSIFLAYSVSYIFNVGFEIKPIVLLAISVIWIIFRIVWAIIHKKHKLNADELIGEIINFTFTGILKRFESKKSLPELNEEIQKFDNSIDIKEYKPPIWSQIFFRYFFCYCYCFRYS